MAIKPDRAPNQIDLHVGARIRLRRRQTGVSQQQLADALGITFQQVQKYERGANRVSASKLYEIAQKLAVPVAFMFEGLDQKTVGAETPEGERIRVFLTGELGFEAAEVLSPLPPLFRREILDHARRVGLLLER